jgi:hypothetical protein
MPKHISLSDVACSSHSVSDFWFAIGFRLVVVRVVGFDPRSVSAWPSPAQPGPARASLAPLALPMRAPPPPDSFVSFDFSRAVTSLSLFHLSLSPRGALGFGVEIVGIWIPGGEFSPPLPSPSLSPPPPLLLLHAASLPARPRRPRPPRPHRPVAAPASSRVCARAAPSARPRARRAPPHARAPSRPRRAQPPAPLPSPRARAPREPSPCHALLAPARPPRSPVSSTARAPPLPARSRPR